jgi:SAM-dependent methyltransferase
MNDPALIQALTASVLARSGGQVLDANPGDGALGAALAGRGLWRVGLGEGLPASAFDEQLPGRLAAVPALHGRFDEVLLVGGLSALDRPADTIRALARALKPGGWLRLAQRVPWGPADADWMAWLLRREDPRLRSFLQEAHLRAACVRAELDELESLDLTVHEPVSLHPQIRDHLLLAPAALPIRPAGEGLTIGWRWILLSARSPL